MISIYPLRDPQEEKPAGYCRCGAELYGDEEECPDCKNKEEENNDE